MKEPENMTISLVLSEQEAWALAQFVKRVGWKEMRDCAVDDDEAYHIRAAVDVVMRALAREGMAPR